MSQARVAPRVPGTIMPMNEDDSGDQAWSRFWLGIACVIAFMITVVLLVAATHGVHAAADSGLVLLILALAAGLIDGVVLRRRRGRGRGRIR